MGENVVDGHNLRDIFKICRNNFLFLDRDGPRGTAPNSAAAKYLIEVLPESHHVTYGYEFEWYFPEKVAREIWQKFPESDPVFEDPAAFGVNFYKFLAEKNIISKNYGEKNKTKFARKAMEATERAGAHAEWFYGPAGEDLSILVNNLGTQIIRYNPR